MIKETLREAYDTLETCGYKVYGVFLYGSQNYETATRGSDEDCKAVVIPDFMSLVSGKRVKMTLHLKKGECDVKDIRDYRDCLKKQSMNYVETLFTKYFLLNPEFAGYHADILGMAEKIARMDEKKAVDGLLGTLFQVEKKLTKDTESTHDDIEKYGYHLKSLANIKRLSEAVKKYVNNAPYRNVLKRPSAKPYRKEPVSNYEELAREWEHEAIGWYESFKPRPKDVETETKLDNIVTSILWTTLYRELTSQSNMS